MNRRFLALLALALVAAGCNRTGKTPDLVQNPRKLEPQTEIKLDPPPPPPR